MLTEINIDAVVGPTHHYGGLGVGNLASQQHAQRVSQPREAALEGLRKASLIASLGVPQYLLLPPRRPRWEWLDELGFRGSRQQQLDEARHTQPRILSAMFSSAFMWAANSATVSAAVDTSDGRLHLTPANLISSWHRAAEAEERRVDLSSFFEELPHCQIHAPLPGIVPLRDEGAANHMRVCDPTGQIGFDVFVYGADDDRPSTQTGFLARQTKAACQAIARRHQLSPQRTFFLQQHPTAIAAGVFHNDVIATSHQGLLLHHELAFLDAQSELERLETNFHRATGRPLIRHEVSSATLPLEAAVQSYFFNSQIVTPLDCGRRAVQPRMVLICPQQCREIEASQQLINELLADSDNPLESVHYVALPQSMCNGGGPACLRLRIPLADDDTSRLPRQLRLDTRLEEQLAACIERWYPESLDLPTLCDLELVQELTEASDRLRSAVWAE